MAATRLTKKAAATLRDIDDMVHIFTGKRIRDHVKRVVDLVSEDIEKEVMGKAGGPDAIPEAGPYTVLHCRPGCSDAVLKYRFRSLVRELHPDSGKFPDPVQYQKVVEAYSTIVEERKQSRDSSTQ